jgi:exodeoxyribonuclease V gamma subunit
MALRILRSNNLDAVLEDVVARSALLRAHPLEPLSLVVPSSGLGRWLQQGIAWKLGVSANLRIEFAGSLIWSMAGACLPGLTGQSPFAPVVMQWRLLHSLQQIAAGKADSNRAFNVLKPFFEQARPAEYVQFAQALANQFDRYLAFRLDWLDHWQQNRLIGLGSHEAWQAHLWRDLLAGLPQVGREHPLVTFEAMLRSPVTPPRLTAALEHWPSSLTVVGLEGMAPRYARIFCLLASHVDVNLVQLMPSQAYFRDLVGLAPARSQLELEFKREAEQTNVLLARWGRSAAESLDSLLQAQEGVAAVEVDHFVSSQLCETWLGRVRAALDAAEPLQAPLAPGRDDLSLQVHACHNLQRQLEVLHEVLLGCVEDLPDLQLDQILVHCPNLEQVEDALPASWGLLPKQQALAWRIVGGRGQGNLLLEGLLDWLACARGQMLARDIVELAQRPLFQSLWNLGDHDIALWTEWLRVSGARGGLDRQEHDSLPRALDRLLAGFALDPNTEVPHALRFGSEAVFPLTGEIAGEGEQGLGLLDALYRTLHQMQFWRNNLSGTASVVHWFAQLQVLIAELYSGVPRAYEEQRARLQIIAAQLAESAAIAMPESADQSDLSFEVVQAMLQSQAQQATLGAAPTGAITFAPAGALRHVPARVSVWLQMEDQSFPGAFSINAWDLMQSHPRAADPNPLSVDRAQFLDSIVATSERLILLYSGFDERTNEARKNSVLVDDLRDLFARSGLESFFQINQHPIHPFSPVSTPIRRYERLWHEVAGLAAGERHADLAFVGAAAHWPDVLAVPEQQVHEMLLTLLSDVRLEKRFQRFFENPSRAWLQYCVQMRLPFSRQELPIHERYSLTRDIRKGLREVAQQAAPKLRELDWSDHPILGGAVLAQAQLHYLDKQVRAVDQALQERKDTKVFVVRGTPNSYEILRYWLGYLVDCARGSQFSQHCVLSIEAGESAVLPTISQEQAQRTLRQLLQVYIQAQLTPCPFFLNAAMAYRKKPDDRASIQDALLGKVESLGEGRGPQADMEDPSHALVWRARVPVAAKLYPLWTTILGEMPDSLFSKGKKAKAV